MKYYVHLDMTSLKVLHAVNNQETAYIMKYYSAGKRSKMADTHNTMEETKPKCYSN